MSKLVWEISEDYLDEENDNSGVVAIVGGIKYLVMNNPFEPSWDLIAFSVEGHMKVLFSFPVKDRDTGKSLAEFIDANVLKERVRVKTH